MHPSPSNVRTLTAPLLVAGATTALVFAAGLVSGRTLFGPDRAAAPPPDDVPASPALSTTLTLAASTAPAADSCGLPAGISVDALDPADRSFALRRGFLCADRQAGRLSADEYRTRLALLDLAHPAPDILPPAAETADEIAWASTVRAYSSQYTDSEWSAARALGAPDVPTAGGDDPNAWASEGADDRVEFLEVGFDQPRRAAGIDIVENHNPGAVTRVELIATDGTRTVAYSSRPAPTATPSLHRRLDIPCTAKPIAAVRITLDSTAVSDWNEIDAIGLRPCAP